MPKIKSYFSIPLLFAFLFLLNQCGSNEDCSSELRCGSHSSNNTSISVDSNTSFRQRISTLIQTVCNAAERCDPSLSASTCVQLLTVSETRQIWDNFGLRREFLSNEEVISGLNSGTIRWENIYYTSCLQELNEVCDNNEDSSFTLYPTNIENIIPENSPCSHLIND